MLLQTTRTVLKLGKTGTGEKTIRKAIKKLAYGGQTGLQELLEVLSWPKVNDLA